MRDIDICSNFFATANKGYGISILDLDAITNSISEINVPQHSSVLSQNYPNPFNPFTIIKFTTENTEKNTELIIYNLKGQKVKTLVNEVLPAGKHSVIWDGRDYNQQPVVSGIYFYKLNMNGKTEAVKKCLLLK